MCVCVCLYVFIYFIVIGAGVMTSLAVGSLLDDNLWHDVVISRNRRNIVFSVDRVRIDGKIKGEFFSLNLNREVCNIMNYLCILK